MRLRGRRLLEPERVAALAHRRPERDDRATADATLGLPGGRGGGGHRDAASFIGPEWCHGPPERVATRQRRTYQRPAAATRASTSAVVRAVTMAPSAPSDSQRSSSARGSRVHAESASRASFGSSNATSTS